MSQSSNNSGKKLIRIDVSSDSVCPWCVIGKKNLDKAIAQSKDQFDFEVRWHPYLLNPSAPKQGVSKRDIQRQKLGPQYETIMAQTVEMFRGMGLEYDLSGLTGNTMDSHRLITYAAHQGYDKQHALVEELFVGYFSKGKFIGDHKFLVECADKVGVEGAAEFLKDPNNGVQEVYADLQKYSGNLTGVPYYVVNGKHKLNGGQTPEVFLTTFQKAAKDSNQ